MQIRTLQIMSAMGIWILMVMPIALSCAYADGDGDGVVVDDPMEKRNIGDVRLIVPKGSLTYRQGDLRVIEGASEYTARMLVAVDERIGKIDSDLSSIVRELGELRKEIEELKKRPLVSSPT